MPTVSESQGTHTVRVDLGSRSYDVLVGEALLGSLPDRLRQHCPGFGTHCAMICDPVLVDLYANPMIASLNGAGIDVTQINVKRRDDVPSETAKSMTTAAELCSGMLRSGHDRKSFIIALGGGVIGDLAGFVAAIFQRGIPFVQIPTTIVSQVDSSVGGKTGVNTPEGKNLIGAFHQPSLVVADTDTLGSLQDREYNQGFAEVIKHAAIRDADMLDTIETQGLSRENLAPLIARNVAIKATIVEADERETSGTRALLNFGHTIGHGIENAAGYGTLLHGEAISLGLVAAARLSVAHSTLTQPECDRIIGLLRSYNLPVTLPDSIGDPAILAAMRRDKKFESGNIRFVLLRSLGDAYVSDQITINDIRIALHELRKSEN